MNLRLLRTAAIAVALVAVPTALPLGAGAAPPTAPAQGVALATSGSYGGGIQGTQHLDAFRAISCPAPGQCTAVGTVKDADGNALPTTVDQVDGRWGTAQVVNPDGHLPGSSGGMNAISCTSVRNCTAAGSITDDAGNALAVVVREVDGVWGWADAMSFADGSQGANPSSRLTSISCTAVDSCTAVGGFWNAAGGYESFVATEVGGDWGQASPLDFPDGVRNPEANDALNQVACSSPGNCTAVGYFRDAGFGQQAMSVTQVDGVWGEVVPASFPVGVQSDHGDAFTSVSCTSAGNCTAAGFYMYPTYQQAAMTAVEVDGAWAPAETISLPASLQAGSAYSQFQSISCSSAGNCSAVGLALDVDYQRVAIVDTEAGGTWGEAQEVTYGPGVHDPTRYADALGPVSCSGDGSCTAGGTFATAGGFNGAMLVTQTDGVWGDAMPMTYGKGMSHSSYRVISSISCSSPGLCGAVGAFSGSSFRSTQAMAVSYFARVPAPVISAQIGVGQYDVGPRVQWSPPNLLVGPVRRYVVTATDTTTGDLDTCTTTGSGRACRLLHLTHGHGYAITVAAKEVVGQGRFTLVVRSAESDSASLGW